MDDVLVLRGARAIDPASALDAEVDVVIERGRIARVGPDAARGVSGDRVRQVQAAGKWLWPGLVDLHTHLREPGQEYKEDLASGLAAAAAGGFVAVCAMPNTRPVNDSRAVTEMLVAKSRALGGTRLHPIGAITVGLEGKRLTEMADLKDAGTVAVSDDGKCVMSAAVMRRALEYARTFDLPVVQHAEDQTLTEGAQMHEGAVSARLGLRGWPRAAEDAIVARDLILAKQAGARYHLAHASTRGAVELVREAKARGIAATAEVTPHHLLLSDAACIGYDTACKVNPPLREAEDVEALVRALADGAIDCIATDHAPHTSIEKDCEFAEAAFGIAGLETCVAALLSLVRSGALPVSRLVDALTAAPARVVGLDPPRIREGARADLVLVDPRERWTIEPARFRSKARNTPLAGREVEGRVRMTICEGRVVHEVQTP